MTTVAYWTCERPGHPHFGGCGVKHRSPATAERCLDSHIARYRRIPGGKSYCPWYVVGYDADGNEVKRRDWDLEMDTDPT